MVPDSALHRTSNFVTKWLFQLTVDILCFVKFAKMNMEEKISLESTNN